MTISDFASGMEDVEAFQVLSFLGIDSEQIVVNGKSLVGTLQGNGFCTQSENFDFLLDLDGKPAYPSEGELYAPVFYSKDDAIKKGDTIVVSGIPFTVAGFVRDSQMNSALAYSKRFVVNATDHVKLEPFGALVASGCVLGFCRIFLFYWPMLECIRLNFGDSGNNSTAFWLGLIGVIFLFYFIFFYVRMNLRWFRHIFAVEAIRFGMSEKTGKIHTLRLSKNKLLSTNLFLGISDVLTRKRLYGTMLAVVMLEAFIIIVPQNLYHTISSESFVTYMGIGRCDLRMDIQQNGDIDKRPSR